MVPRRDDVVPLVTPLTFEISVLELWGALVQGARLVVAAPGRPDPRAVGRLVRERGATFLSAASGVLARLVDDALDDLAGVRIAVSRRRRGRARDRPPAARRRPARPADQRLRADRGDRPGAPRTRSARPTAPLPIGRPLPGYTARVADDGELLIGGPGVARGYRFNPAATAERFVDGWHRTGDHVRQDADGALHFLGRLDRRGQDRRRPGRAGEIEHTLAGHPVSRTRRSPCAPVAGTSS